jgi:hypothetical protein
MARWARGTVVWPDNPLVHTVTSFVRGWGYGLGKKQGRRD